MSPTASDTYKVDAATGAITITHRVQLHKQADRQLNDNRVRGQVDAILAGVNTAQRAKRGWNTSANGGVTRDLTYDDTGRAGTYVYLLTLEVVCHPDKPRPSLEAEFQTILNVLTAKASLNRWKVASVDGAAYSPAEAVESLLEAVAGEVGYAPLTIPDDWLTRFDHLYGLDAHIRRIKDALEAGVQSGFTNRFHCVLIGPPGCGKSDICHTIKRALGEESVLEFDATATTAAGAIKEIESREELPRVILIEEIEKADEKSLQWLLSVLDLRAEIRKTTARGNVLKDTKCFAVATVNNEALFLSQQSGALASRFANKIHFNRPPRELLERIVLREIARIKGNSAWAKPTLDYADAHQIGDPRAVIAIALCGKDRLLDGSYQRDLDATSTTDSAGWQ